MILTGLLFVTAAPTGAPQKIGPPETFSGTAEAKRARGSISGLIDIHLNRYTPDFDRTAVENGLKHGGYNGFLAALRRAPDVGSVALGEQTFTIRYARENATAKGRTIVVVTDRPMYFLGAGAPNPKAKEAYAVGLIQLEVDDAGRGSGTMSGAARVRPGGEMGVQVDSYADVPITLKGVTRKGS
jgi:hypothetical protein